MCPDERRGLTSFVDRELHLQIQLLDMKALLDQTKHEPRLKGPFPFALYDDMLSSCQTIIERMHSMRCVTTRPDW